MNSFSRELTSKQKYFNENFQSTNANIIFTKKRKRNCYLSVVFLRMFAHNSNLNVNITTTSPLLLPSVITFVSIISKFVSAH